MQELVSQIISYIKGTWRHRWPALVIAWVVCVLGWIFVYLMPDRYEASARVYVDTQSMLKPLLTGLAVQPNLDQQVAMMSKTVITRPNLEKVLRMADLDIKAKSTSEQESLIDSLAKRIELKSAGKDNLFALSYADKDPALAKKIVQSLLTIFVESSLGDKRKDADSARRFIDEQIKIYEEKLITAESALKEFKQRNLGLMPGEGKDFYERLTEMGGAVNQAKLELRELENARDAIKQQLAGEEPVVLADAESEFNSGLGGDAGYVNPELDQRIQSLKTSLDSLRLKFTEQHPDIIATKRIIAELESQKQKEATDAIAAQDLRDNEEKAAAEQSALTARPRRPDSMSLVNQNPVFQQLKAALAESEARAAAMRARVQEYEARFNDLKNMANQVPQVEADLKQLTRDYEVNKANYEKLLARRESAQISSEMESTSGGLDFRIIDPPRVPNSPSGPNRPLFVSMVLFSGLAIGILYALAMSQIRPTFNDRKSLREITGLPLLGNVSMIWTAMHRRKMFGATVAYGATFAGLLLCYGLLLGFFVYQVRLA